MRGEDGRRGRVLSLRLTDEERAELTKAAEKSRGPYDRWGPVAIGPFILRAALEKARAGAAAAKLQAGTTALEHGSTKPRPRKKGKR